MIEYLLLSGLGILLFATLRALLSRRQMRRCLRDLAMRRRLNYSPTDLMGVYERYQHLDLVSRGHSRYIWNVLYGTTPQGLVTLFAFAYEKGLGAGRTNHQRWIAVLESPSVHLPWRACKNGSLEGNESSVGWQIHAEHELTRCLLKELDLNAQSEAPAPDREWEVQGRLVATAAPYSHDPALPSLLLDEVLRMATELAKAENVPSPAAPQTPNV